MMDGRSPTIQIAMDGILSYSPAPSYSGFFSRRMLVLAVLGLSSGLPLVLVTKLLSIWLAASGMDVTKIGLFGLATLPYSLKFIWSPLVDRYVPPILGRRRGWIFISQILLIGGIIGMAREQPGSHLALAALLVATVSATQDIAIDAFRTDLLRPEERGPGAAIFVAGYRAGMLAPLLLLGMWNLSITHLYDLAAGAMVIGMAATLAAGEPVAAPPRSLAEAVVAPIRQFMTRSAGWIILLLALIFKLPEYLAAAVSDKFLIGSLKFTAQDVSLISGALGTGLTIGGALAGGAVVKKLGTWKSLWIFGVLHSVSNLAFLILSRTGPRHDVLVAVIAVENICVGLTTAGFFAWMMAQCDPRYSAFQYALLSGLMALGRSLAAPLAGILAAHLGWTAFFGVSALFGIPGLLLLPWVRGESGLYISEARSDPIANPPASRSSLQPSTQTVCR